MKMITYKKLIMMVLATAFAAITTSCHHGRSTTIVQSENGNTKRIEYSGQVVFSKDKTGIDYISEGGYVKFEHNGKKIEAESEKGKVVYEYNGGDGTTSLNAGGKQFLAEAVQEISRQQEKIAADKAK